MAGEDEPVATRKRLARSGRVSYAEPVTLYESSKRRIVLVSFFVQRSDREEQAIKIQTLVRGQPPFEWVEQQEKTISIPHEGARRLLKGLKTHLHLEDQEDGGYLIIPVGAGTVEIGQQDPQVIAAALTRVLSQEEIVTHLADLNLSDELIHAFQGAIRFKQMRAAVDELRELLDTAQNDEAEYQRWCEAHSWVFGNAYLVKDEVRAISAGDKLDLLLPTAFSGFRDFVELKRPDMQVLLWDKSHRNFFFSQEVSKALGQCHRYMDVLHEAAQHGLRDHPEVVAYHPRATIVIGRSHDWAAERHRALHGLNRRLSGVTIMTYDHLLAQGQRLLDTLNVSGTKHQEGDAPPDVDDW